MGQAISKRIGIYGGSFDPIHFGHLNLAVEIAEAHQLDELCFVPAFISPHKQDQEPLDAEHRLQMTRLAVEDIPNAWVLDWEIKRNCPSYTVDTVAYLLSRNSKEKFYLVVGDDTAQGLPRWHRIDDLVKMLPILVGKRTRTNYSFDFPGNEALTKAVKKGLTETSLLEISSTACRARLKKGLYCGAWIPGKVLDYIQENVLYCCSKTT